MTDEVLPLRALQTSLLEITSVALEGGGSRELCSDLWGTRLYNRSKLWGVLNRLVRCIVYALLRRQTYTSQFENTVKKTQEALLHHLLEAEKALAEYHTGLASLNPTCSETLASFYRTFYPIASLLEDESVTTKVDGLFQELFQVKAADFRSRLRAFQDQQVCLRFELLTYLKIPWNAFAVMAGKDMQVIIDEDPTLQAWLKELATHLINREPTDQYVWELAQTLPAIWRSLQRALGSRLVMDYSTWIVFLKRNGMQDRFPLSTPQESEGTVQSDSISRYHRDLYRQRYSRHLPEREVVRVSMTGRSAILKSLGPQPSLPVLFKALASYPRTYVRSLEDTSLYPEDFGMDEIGRVRSVRPLKDIDFDMERFDAWVWKAAGRNEGAYRAIYLLASMKETVVGKLFHDFRIASATTSWLGSSRPSDLNAFTISHCELTRRNEYEARFDTVFQRMQQNYTALTTQVDDLPNWSRNSVDFWRAHAWELFPGLRWPERAKEHYRAKYLSVYSPTPLAYGGTPTAMMMRK